MHPCQDAGPSAGEFCPLSISVSILNIQKLCLTQRLRKDYAEVFLAALVILSRPCEMDVFSRTSPYNRPPQDKTIYDKIIHFEVHYHVCSGAIQDRKKRVANIVLIRYIVTTQTKVQS
jgi:hypothetical protein